MSRGGERNESKETAVPFLLKAILVKNGDFGILQIFKIGDFGIFAVIKFGDFGIFT